MSADKPAARYLVIFDKPSGSYTIVDSFTGAQLMRTYDAQSAAHYRDTAEQGRDLEQEQLEALKRARGQP